jgi:hypothetical protein
MDVDKRTGGRQNALTCEQFDCFSRYYGLREPVGRCVENVLESARVSRPKGVNLLVVQLQHGTGDVGDDTDSVALLCTPRRSILPNPLKLQVTDLFCGENDFLVS